jgi:aminotransferase
MPARYAERLSFFSEVLTAAGYPCAPPGGSFYLWAEVPDGDAWTAAADLARRGGLVVAPGEFFGPHGASRLRVAMVRPLESLRLVADRLTSV